MTIVRRQLTKPVNVYFLMPHSQHRVQSGEEINCESVVYIGDPNEDIVQLIVDDEQDLLFQDFVPVFWESWDPGKEYEKCGFVKTADLVDAL